ncbi:MAG: DEAD/DEAH box helicase [Bacteroidota bacterium]
MIATEEMRQFKKDYKALEEAQQNVLKILAIAYEYLKIEELRTCLNHCRITDNHGQYFKNEATLLRFLELLEGKGFVHIFEDEEGLTQVECHRGLIENVMRYAVVDHSFDFYVKNIKDLFPFRGWYGKLKGFHRSVREMRIALYQGRWEIFNSVYTYASNHHKEQLASFDLFHQLFDTPFDARWLSTFHLSIQREVIGVLLFRAIKELAPIEPYLNFLRAHPNVRDEEDDINPFLNLLFTGLILQGKIQEATELAQVEDVDVSLLVRRGWLNFLNGQNGKSLSQFSQALKIFRKSWAHPEAFFQEMGGVMYVLALLKKQDTHSLTLVEEYAFHTRKSKFACAFQCIQSAAAYLKGDLKQANTLLSGAKVKSALDLFFYVLVSRWNQKNIEEEWIEKLRAAFVLAEENHYRWLAFQIAGLLAELEIEEAGKRSYAQRAEQLGRELGMEKIFSLVKVTERWEHSLELLNSLNLSETVSRQRVGKKSRVAWFVDFERKEIQPKLQLFGSDGKWSKGRNISLKKISTLDVDGLTADDHRVVKAIKSFQYGYNGTANYEIDFDEAIKELVGHPYLFLRDSPSIVVELLEKDPELLVEPTKDGYEMRFMHDFDTAGTVIVKETPTRYIIMNVADRHVKIQKALGGGALKIPNHAKQQLLNAVSNVSKNVIVQSGLDEHLEGIPTVESDATIHIHMLPMGNGFKLEFFVKPFKDQPPYFKPAEGRKNVITEIEGAQVVAKRNIELETQNATFIEQACPTFATIPSHNREWLFPDTQSCLKILMEIEPLRAAKRLILEHPKGEPIRLKGTIGFDQVAMRIQRDNDWFGVTGKVQVNSDLVMDFKDLLEKVEASDSQFIEVSEGEFIALTDQLRKQLGRVNALLTDTGDSLNFHPLAAPLLEEFAEHIEQLEVDASWKTHLQKLESYQDFTAEVPTTFKAELRDYQKVGFEWLSRLAHWGVGACLADDMGLGKTIQALAVLVDRAKDGPAMVIAPASVCRNWLRETERFAPSLNPILFGQGDRKSIVRGLGANDFLIVSYGLLPQESELLISKEFNTVILDEAQAIKNRNTKRSKAAMELKANFKILTTGTPVENHLGELWNLFNFLNPGLLGGLRNFQEKYAIPIEKMNDPERKDQLRRLIQPFILRRRKDDVLTELPSKTEITLTVELSERERAFYEAIRQQAVENLSDKDEDKGKNMQILAEIMRLRQAACHPKMVMPHTDVESSKLKLFENTVMELMEGGHKALVFSQFVKHLNLVRALLDEKGIHYQYLDGSTPLKQREQAIDAFQSGSGDLFLISLKAGGVGLNLTAADYVLHLDPWWNPAVEDQASDRAHRIGQTRPVTILRLVAENTIEEKIVKLHHTKRDLADSLLEGTDSTGRMSARELLELIKEG